MWGNTGSPGEVTCAHCHKTYALSSGPGYMQISTVPALINNQYVPGQTYSINITVGQAGDSTFACDVEVLDSLHHNAGTLIQTNSVATLNNNIPNNRMNIFGKGTNQNFYVFSFNWKAPASGEVNLYTAGMRCNNDGDFTGDYVYNDSLLHLKPNNIAGIITAKAKDDLLIYPNPVKESFVLRFTGSEANVADEVEVFDLLGKLIYKNQHATTPLSIDAKNWLSGLYYVRVKQRGNFYAKQLIKQ